MNDKARKSDAQSTIEFSILMSLANTSPTTGITIDKSEPVVDSLLEELFHPSVIWSVKEYIEELEDERQD